MIEIMSAPVVSQLSALATRRRHLRVREILFRANDPVRALFIVERGAVQLTRSLAHGGEVTLQRAMAGEVLAEASIFSRRYHCGAVAMEAAVLQVVPMLKVHEAVCADPILNSSLMRHLAHELQRARSHAEILALKTVKARVEAWKTFHDREIPPKGQWRMLASEIAVSSEALYRELAKKRVRR
jgi:CRP/FNR family transcriptional regulator, dissimilatory nitrate respiration regulator